MYIKNERIFSDEKKISVGFVDFCFGGERFARNDGFDGL